MKRIILLVLVIFMSFQLKAQIFETIKPIVWQYNIKKISDTEYNLKITAQIAGGWHLYSQFFEAGGPVPLKFTFEKNENYELIGIAKETPKPKTELDDIFNINVSYFSRYAVFTQKIKLKRKSEQKIKVIVKGQACKDEDGQCVLTKDEHVFEIK